MMWRLFDLILRIADAVIAALIWLLERIRQLVARSSEPPAPAPAPPPPPAGPIT